MLSPGVASSAQLAPVGPLWTLVTGSHPVFPEIHYAFGPEFLSPWRAWPKRSDRLDA